MGKRQVRIFQQNLVMKLPELLNREVQIILLENRVFRGVVNEFSDVSLCIKDSRRNNHTFRLADIEELVYDLETLR
jgi:hypothetical protein